jgi:prepilin-type N-terminal cleavage/methylation domain-containing protein/prepilin-type processing-associated H-X9-DG protein
LSASIAVDCKKAMRKAFTLIELLVVIAIIAILAAILFPVFSQAKQAAKATASLSNSKQIALGLMMYTQDSDEYFVIAQANGPGPGSFTIPNMMQPVTPWTSLVYPYTKNVDLFRDPLGPAAAAIAPFSKSDSTLIAPTYGFNFAFLNTYQAAGFSPVSDSAVNASAATVLTAAKNDYWETPGFHTFIPPAPAVGWNSCTSYLAFPPAGAGLGVSFNWGMGGVFNTDISTPEAGKFSGGAAPRFSGAVAVSFVDGHVKRLRAEYVGAGTGFYTNGVNAASPVAQVTVPAPGSPLSDQFIWDLN